MTTTIKPNLTVFAYHEDGDRFPVVHVKRDNGAGFALSLALDKNSYTSFTTVYGDPEHAAECVRNLRAVADKLEGLYGASVAASD